MVDVAKTRWENQMGVVAEVAAATVGPSANAPRIRLLELSSEIEQNNSSPQHACCGLKICRALCVMAGGRGAADGASRPIGGIAELRSPDA